MIAPADLAACHAAIRTGSLSFHAASKLLPRKVRDPALALYAFCRIADDAVDDGAVIASFDFRNITLSGYSLYILCISSISSPLAMLSIPAKPPAA